MAHQPYGLEGSAAISRFDSSTPKSTVHAVWDRRKSGEQVALYIRAMVFEGELRPGQRVPQDEIAASLGLSRIPVREAIIALEREGIVTSRPHKGSFINPITRDTIRDQYELYGLAFGLAVRRATERGGDSFIDALGLIHRRLLATDDPDEFSALNDEFFGLIVETAGSPRVQATLRVLAGFVPGNYFVQIPGATETQRRGTTAMVRAARKQGGEAAAAECLALMRRQGEAVIKVLSSRGFFTD